MHVHNEAHQHHCILNHAQPDAGFRTAAQLRAAVQDSPIHFMTAYCHRLFTTIPQTNITPNPISDSHPNRLPIDE